MSALYYESSLTHHGVLGMKWGVRRYQDRHGRLTKAGRKHVTEIRSKIESDSDVAKMIDRMDRANKRLKLSEKPMNDFLNNEKLSSKYINDWVKKHPEYPDEPEYDRYEWRSALKGHGYDLPPYKNYAKDHGIDWQKQYSEARKAFSEHLDAMFDYTNAVVKKYGEVSTTKAYSAVDHSIIIMANDIARERGVMRD